MPELSRHAAGPRARGGGSTHVAAAEAAAPLAAHALKRS